MDETNQNINVRRYNWFLSKKRAPKVDTQKQSESKLSIDSNRCKKNVSVRKRFQQLTSANVNAYECELVAKLSDSTIDDGDRFAVRTSLLNRNENTVGLVGAHHNLSTPNSIHYSQNISLSTAPCGNAPATSGDSRSAVQITNTMVEMGQRIHKENNSKWDSTMKKMRAELSQYGWYWGKLNRASAQKRLARKENGSFLVRDSQTDEKQFTISFRSSGMTLHCRIDYCGHYW